MIRELISLEFYSSTSIFLVLGIISSVYPFNLLFFTFLSFLNLGLLKESKAECEGAVRLSDSLTVQLTDSRHTIEVEV